METTQPTQSIIRKAPSRWRPARCLKMSILPRFVLTLGSILFIIPFYWMFVSAVKSIPEGTKFPPTLIPATWVWQNFIDAVNYIPFGVFATNSLIITVGATIGAVLSNTLIAYGFSRIQWPGRNLLLYLW